MPQNESHVLTFEFTGRTSRRDDAHDFVETEPQLITQLNAKSTEIARTIQQEIERSLPPSVGARVEIAFHEGSVRITGLVVILDWMATLGSAAEFTILLRQLIRIAIQQVIRPWLTGYDPVQMTVRRTASIPDPSPSDYAGRPPTTTQGKYDPQLDAVRQERESAIARLIRLDRLRSMMLVTLLNTLLLLVLIVFQLMR